MRKIREISDVIENVLSNYSTCIKYEVDNLLIDALNKLDDLANQENKELLEVIYSLVDESSWKFPYGSEYKPETMYVCDCLETCKWLLEELMEDKTCSKDAQRL